MRKSVCMIVIFAMLILIAGCSASEEANKSSSDPKRYTHEELIALPGDQLLNVFIENGLEINDRLQSTFTEDELQELFKTEFESWCIGISTRSDTMYFDLAEQTKAIYEKITRTD